jgi:mono/diheme cytochrome c family protein
MTTRQTLVLTLFIAFSLQNCTKDKADFDKADTKRGGIYYDTFWASEGGFLKDTSSKINKFIEHAPFFKCSQCHGWDLQGTKGGYIGSAGNATRPNVSGIDLVAIVRSKTSEDLFKLIKTGSNPSVRRPFTADLATYHPTLNNKVGDQMPNFAELLTDQQVWDIVKYLKFEALDVLDLYDFKTTGAYPTGKITFSNLGKGGVASKGKQLYVTKGCGNNTCHGAKGTNLLLGDTTFTVGSFVRNRPYTAHHKIRYGKLGTPMTARGVTLSDLKDIYKALSDTLAFPSVQ